MAMINCGECGASVSTEAKTCPGCGANRKVFRRSADARKPMSWPKKIGIAFGAVFGLGVVGQLVALPGGGQVAQAESAQDKQTDQRNHAAYLSARALKASLRNPDSLAFQSILASDDGSVICIKYRAQNGFGGINLEHVVFKDGNPSQSRSSWQAHCAGKLLVDETAVQHVID
jgi:rRNA maturation endonuclease Nob1